MANKSILYSKINNNLLINIVFCFTVISYFLQIYGLVSNFMKTGIQFVNSRRRMANYLFDLNCFILMTK